MSAPTRRDRLELEGYLGKLADVGEGRVYFDLAGPAVYQIEPSWRTVVLCVWCRFLDLVMTIPARAHTWHCPRCGVGAWLEPPTDVLEAQLTALQAAAAKRLRRAIQ